MKPIKYFSCLLLFFIGIKSYGQRIYFPLEHYKDSVELARHMPDLANRIIALYKNTDKRTYYSVLFHCQLASGQYSAALTSIEALEKELKGDSIETKAVNFKFKVFAAAKISELQKQQSLTQAYTFILPQAYQTLSDKVSFYASWDSYSDLSTLKNELNKLLEHQKGKRNIAIEDAVRLCMTYNQYTICCQTQSYAIRLIREEDNSTFIIEDSVLITTRDQSVISATVVRKRNCVGPQPAILVFSIYSSPRIIREAAERGYVCVVAYTRGKRYSTVKTIEPYEHDGEDAYDVIDWISRQPWSNGKVGMLGGSYLGFTQWAAVKNIHPALKTIVPMAAVGPGVDFPMMNNVCGTYALHWLNYVSLSKDGREAYFQDWDKWETTLAEWYKSGRSFRTLDSFAGQPNVIFQRWLQHPSYDDYWERMTLDSSDFSKMNIPVLTVTGYYDADLLGATDYFKKHYTFNKNAEHYLLIGPYDHNGAQGYISPWLDGYTLDSAALINTENIIYQWYDYVLKDSTRPGFLKDKIMYQVMGANQWKHACSPDKISNDTFSFYLTRQRAGRHHFLSYQKKPRPAYIKQKVNFKNRNAQSCYNNIIEKRIHTRNGRAFVSDPFDKSFELNGSFFGEMIVQINKKDMDIWVEVYELNSNGNYMKLSSYLTRASYAGDRSTRQLLKPGEREIIPINNSTFTSRMISEGSRLVVLVSVNKSQGWQINYGTGKDVSDESVNDADIPLKIKWSTDSVIKIPVMTEER